MTQQQQSITQTRRCDNYGQCFNVVTTCDYLGYYPPPQAPPAAAPADDGGAAPADDAGADAGGGKNQYSEIIYKHNETNIFSFILIPFDQLKYNFCQEFYFEYHMTEYIFANCFYNEYNVDAETFYLLLTQTNQFLYLFTLYKIILIYIFLSSE